MWRGNLLKGKPWWEVSAYLLWCMRFKANIVDYVISRIPCISLRSGKNNTKKKTVLLGKFLLFDKK